MLTGKIFLRKFIHKVSGIISFDSIVIIQILSNTPCANWEMLKNETRKITSAGFLSHKSVAQSFT